MPIQTDTQIAIIGGGVCGLWLLNQLSREGYQTLLFEKDALGSGQSLASQGMIHGGIKYTLGGFTTPASESIARMPEVWRQCISGGGPVDLSGVEILSENYHMFSDGALTSKVTAFFGSKSLRGRVNALDQKDYPEVFRNKDFRGNLYELEDLVLNTQSLLQQLSEPYSTAIYRDAPEVNTDSEGNITSITLSTGEILTAEIYIFAAGAGNATLLKNAKAANISMQRRPLHQVAAKGNLPSIYAHAVSIRSASKPRLTLTTHHCLDGDNVWYLGGNLAETGVGKSGEEQIEVAQREVKDLLPWIDIDNLSWTSFHIDRAEPAQENHSRPDFPFVHHSDNALVCWPTKLTLTPMLAEQVSHAISITPNLLAPPKYNLPLATVGISPWDGLF